MHLAGDIIRTIRDKIGYSQVDLANEANISKNIIYKLEKGITDIKCDNFFKLIHAAGYQMIFRPADQPVDESRGEERIL